MKMDIACPVELLSFEQASFGDTRKQAYLNFLNESPHVVTAISGRLSLLGAEGNTIEERRISFGQFAAPAGRRFICHLALDGYPAFVSVSMIVEDVLFDGEEPWALHPTRLVDYTPPVVPDGPERVALVAAAGEDAVCFPEKDGSTWLCVCGRYNRWRWPVCRRCRRERDATLAITPEAAMAAYSKRVEAGKKAPPKVLVDGKARRRASAPQEKKAEKEKPPKRSGERNFSHMIITAVATLLVTGLLVWGVSSIANRLTRPTAEPNNGMIIDIEPDYLEAVR